VICRGNVQWQSELHLIKCKRIVLFKRFHERIVKLVRRISDMMQLSKREIQILLNLLDSEICVTTKELAEQLNVSIRTIKYDLANIRIWLKPRKIELNSQRNKGFWFELTDKQRLSLKNELQEVTRFETFLDQESRVTKIVMILLLEEKTVTVNQLATQLKVSNNTVISDLEKVNEFVSSFQVTLKKKAGQGTLLTGSEDKLRFLMEYLLNHNLTEYDIYQIMNQLIHSNQKKKYSIYLEKYSRFYEIYHVVLGEMSKLLAHSSLDQFNYSELLSITFRVAIAICRLQIGCAIGSFKMIQKFDQQDISFKLMACAFKKFNFPLFEEEYHYIQSDLIQKQHSQNTLELSTRLIDNVSKELDLPFNKNNQLLTNLFAHLSLRLAKKHVFINEYNPFVDDIKNKHPELFLAVTNACQKELNDNAYMVNDSFVAYIALHFLIFFEKKWQESSMVRVVYICSTGLGVTNLIEQKVKEEIPNVKMVGFASVLNALEIIKEKEPDLVISIFPIEGIHIPFLKVNAIPTKEDIQNLKQLIDVLLEKNMIRQHPSKIQDTYTFTQENIETYSKDMIVKGYILYQDLRRMLGEKLKKSYQEAFLLHVLLMIHRIMFKSQYDLDGNICQQELLQQKNLVAQIEQIFSENDLSVNQAELVALFQYIDIHLDTKREVGENE
jgi:mannitol operon transcriptional antiterminator